MIRLAVPLMLLAGACAPTTSETPPPEAAVPAPGVECDATPVENLIGQQVTDALTKDAVKRSGAKTHRVLAPDSMATMDFRTDRLNIMTDANGKIIKFTCG